MNRLGEKKKKPIWPIVLIVMFILALIPGVGSGEEKAPTGITLLAPGQGNPAGPRKTLNYHSYRYAFLENGGEFQVPQDQLGEELGILDGDILADPKANGQKELAATFALGGTLRSVSHYDPEFRLAVTLDGKTYLADRVGRLDGEPMDPAELMETADFRHGIHSMSIRDHMGRQEYKSLTTEVSKTMIRNLAKLTPAELSNEDYEAIGAAQSQGQSYLVAMQLDDGTEYHFYILPKLKLAMLGDCKYDLPADFFNLFGAFFGSLPEEPMPMN